MGEASASASGSGRSVIAVYTTVGTKEEAKRLARAIVERRLAACAQITEIESVYVWKGAVQQEPEWRVLFKTAAERYAALEAAIRELHGYEVPAIYAVAIEEAFAPYARWVGEESSGDRPVQ